MPGDDIAQTTRLVFGELADLPFLPELPGRGPGADITGRAAALLVDMPAQTTPRGWKLADRPWRIPLSYTLRAVRTADGQDGLTARTADGQDGLTARTG